jgi:hypothetical protein
MLAPTPSQRQIKNSRIIPSFFLKLCLDFLSKKVKNISYINKKKVLQE